MATITCRDCGDERTQCPKNTKFCRACRLLREITYWAENRRLCTRCRASFAPIGRQDYLCSTCYPGIRGREVDCVLHQGVGPKLLTGIPVCGRCLRSSARRFDLIAALERGQRQRQRQERNDATT